MKETALKNNAAKLFACKLNFRLLALIVTSILFSTQLFSNQNALLSVNNQGNVGIGILNAKNKLQVAGDSALGGSTGKVTYVSQFGSSGSGNGQFLRIYGMATHPNGNIYVTDMEADRVQIFDANYKFKSAFGTRGTGNGQFITPTGIVVHPNGDLYVVDTMNRRVQIFDPSGRFKGIGPTTSLSMPFGIAIHPNGDTYITNLAGGSDSPFVAVFNASHAFKTKFGSKGTNDGQFIFPHGIVIHPISGDIYVSDIGNNKVQVFDTQHRFKRKLKAMGEDNTEFKDPIGITMDQSRYIYVADTGNHRIQVFGVDDQFRSAFGTMGRNPGQFNFPTGMTVGPNGDIYIAEEKSVSRIQVFNPVPVFAISNNDIGIHTKGLFIQTENNKGLIVQADYSASIDAMQFIIRGQKNPNNQLEIGYHTARNYGSIQAITQGDVVRPLILNPAGGDVGIGATWQIEATANRFQIRGGPSNPKLTIARAQVELPILAYGNPGSWDWVIQDRATGQLYLRSGSSLRYKKDVEAYQDDFSKLLTAQPKAFSWKDSGARDYGYIAEEFHALGLTNLVKYDDKGRPDGIHYDKLPIYTLELIKVLKAENDHIKQTIDQIQKEKDAEIRTLRKENQAIKVALCAKFPDVAFCQ